MTLLEFLNANSKLLKFTIVDSGFIVETGVSLYGSTKKPYTAYANNLHDSLLLLAELVAGAKFVLPGNELLTVPTFTGTGYKEIENA